MKLLSLLATLCLAAATPAFADDPATFPVGAFTFTRPADWAWVPVNSPMRKAQLKVPGADAAASADVTFFFLRRKQRRCGQQRETLAGAV